MNTNLAPFRQRRSELAQDPDLARNVLQDGARRAKAIASQTMREVREAIGLP
jgi:tryptophanyl-tRNA synthetase